MTTGPAASGSHVDLKALTAAVSADRANERSVATTTAAMPDSIAFERALIDEMMRSGPLPFSDGLPVDRSAMSNNAATSPALSIPNADSVHPGTADILDGGTSQQNGALFSKVGEQIPAPDFPDRPLADRGETTGIRPDNTSAANPDPRRVSFDIGDSFSTLKADVHGDRSGNLEMHQGAPPAGFVDLREFSIVGSPVGFGHDGGTSGTTDRLVHQIFYHGDGRPIVALMVEASSIDNVTNKSQMILPDGTIYDYEPWIAKVDSGQASFDAMQNAG